MSRTAYLGGGVGRGPFTVTNDDNLTLAENRVEVVRQPHDVASLRSQTEESDMECTTLVQ